jgi:hypothetical protein
VHTIACCREEIKRNVPILGTSCPEQAVYGIKQARQRRVNVWKNWAGQPEIARFAMARMIFVGDSYGI